MVIERHKFPVSYSSSREIPPALESLHTSLFEDSKKHNGGSK